jgi:hypothetical protein
MIVVKNANIPVDGFNDLCCCLFVAFKMLRSLPWTRIAGIAAATDLLFSAAALSLVHWWL